MKKQNKILIALLLVVCILFGGCKTGKQPNETTENTGTAETTTKQTLIETTPGVLEETTPEILEETTSETLEETTTHPPEETTPDTPKEVYPGENEEEDEAYLNIPVKKARGYVSKDYALKNSSISLRLKFNLDWEHRKSEENGYLLYSNGMEIGRIISGEADDIANWKTIYQNEANPARVKVTEYLEKSGTGETLCFRHRFYYRYMECGQERVITLTIAYGEIDEYTHNELLGNVIHKEHHSDPMYGSLSHLQDQPILVLGNSFIGTSKIGNIYNDIAANSGKSQAMTAYSRGYASPSSYIKDTALMNRIRSGEWEAVFICGFYGDEVSALGVLKEACDQSYTQLIIFPAHNETTTSFGPAMEAYPDLLCIYWKREIDELIKEGRSKWDFCYNDGHKHSTPLAGYVGAMMIWRAIWGEMPNATLTSGAVDQEWADSILGEYLESPTFELISPSKILFLE